MKKSQQSREIFNIPEWLEQIADKANQEMFGDRLWEAIQFKEALDRKALSFRELARRVGALMNKKVDPATVTRWRKGTQKATLREIATLAWVLDVDPGWLGFADASQAPQPGYSVEEYVISNAAPPEWGRRRSVRAPDPITPPTSPPSDTDSAVETAWPAHAEPDARPQPGESGPKEVKRRRNAGGKG